MNHSNAHKQHYILQKARQKTKLAEYFLEKLGVTHIVKSSRGATRLVVEDNQEQPTPSTSKAASTNTQEKEVFGGGLTSDE